MSMVEPIKVRASSSSFAKGSVIFTRYNTGCLRAILAKSHGLKEDFKQVTKDIGAANEERFEKTLEPGIYEREVAVTSAILPDASAVFSGRCDFRLTDSAGPFVVELKSTSSKNKVTDLNQGKITPEVLAQVVNYMIEFETDRGQVVYTFYKEMTPTKEWIFHVSINNDGTILLNGLDSGFIVDDALRHRLLQVETLQLQKVATHRPYNGKAPYVGACGYCPFQQSCDRFDGGEITTTTEFLDACRKELDER